MAAIQNDRDLLLQAASPRVVPIPIPMDQIDGLDDALGGLDGRITAQGTAINSLLNNTRDLIVYATATTFVGSGATTPASVTLTAVRKNELAGAVSWSVTAGAATLTPDGDTCLVSGASVTGNSVTIRARIVAGGANYDAFVTLTRLGSLAGQQYVNLTNQVTGQLANGNVSGLGALALLNVVNLNTQTVGALNGQTQVTNLGDLAYANAIAANQIGAGQLAAGVIYAGYITAEQVNAGILTGRQIRTAASGARIEIIPVGSGSSPEIIATDGTTTKFRVSPDSGPQVVWGRATNNQYGVRGTSTAANSGAGVLGESNNTDAAIYAYNSGTGVGLRVNAVSGPDLLLTPRSSVPSTKVKGSIFFHSTKGLCQSDGTSWYAIQDGTVVT